MKNLILLFTAFLFLNCSSDDNNNQPLLVTVNTAIVGAWSGTFSGGDAGSWNATISDLGAVSGTAYSTTFQANYTITGTVDTAGQLNATVGNSSTGATFVGLFQTNGACNGTWVNTVEGLQGSWEGTKD